MAVIKSLAFCNKNKLKNLKSFVDSELDLSVFHPFPVDCLHHFLPFGYKFLNESFVVIENKKITGLLTIKKTSEKKVKITRLLLEENSIEQGKLLINYVVTTFLSKGAESFYIIVNKENYPVLNMLTSGCNFRDTSKELIYKIEKDEFKTNKDEFNFEHIRKMKLNDINNVVKLINSNIFTYQKTTFHKTKSEIKNSFLKNSEKFVLFNKDKDGIIGYFSILKINEESFLLDFVLEGAYEGFLSDIIRFVKTILIKNGKFKTLYIRLNSYYSNFRELNEILDMEYRNSYESRILVRDFLVAKKQDYTYERMIFNDITPAF